MTDEEIANIAKPILDHGFHKWEGLQPWVFTFARAIAKNERSACHDLSLLNGSNCPTKNEWDMAQSIARAIRARGDV